MARCSLGQLLSGSMRAWRRNRSSGARTAFNGTAHGLPGLPLPGVVCLGLAVGSSFGGGGPP
eukprot:497939-Prorocentrum_lima.AAC.1